MKKLVLVALLAAVGSLAACTSPTDAVITARWSFTHFATDAARSCPTGYQTATIVAQPWDPFTGEFDGVPITDKFDCTDMIGTTLPLDGIFQIWVEIENDAGTNYAQSNSYYIDTADGDVAIDFEIFDDAGFFYLSWELFDKVTNQDLSCSQASDGDGPVEVETVATIVGTSFMLSDSFPCEYGFGTTRPLLADTYTVSVDAAISKRAIGVAPELINKTIRAQNGITDLGHIMIPID